MVVDKLAAGHVSGLGEGEEAHEALVVAEGKHDAHGAADLPALEAHGVHGAGGGAPDALEVSEAALHEDVEDASGEHAAEAAAL